MTSLIQQIRGVRGMEREDKVVGVINTNEKESDGLMMFNPHNIFIRMIFNEPEIFVLRYKRNKEKKLK